MTLKTYGKYYNIHASVKDWLKGNKLSAADLIKNFILMTDAERAELLKPTDRFNISDWENSIYTCFPDYIDRHNLPKIEIRTHSYMEQAICRLTERPSFKKEDINRAVQIILYAEYFKHNKNTAPAVPFPKTSGTQNAACCPKRPLLHVMGEKGWYGAHFTGILRQLPTGIEHFVDVFGGSGYLTELAEQSGMFQTVLYNDDDLNKQDFFDVISKAPADFKALCLTETEESLQDILDKDESLTESERKVLSAAKLFLKSRPENISLGKQLDDVKLTSEIFRRVTRSTTDGLAVARKYCKNANAFIAVDSPYSGTKDYDDRRTDNKKAFLDSDHQELAEMLTKSEAIFIWFGRCTAPRGNKKPYIPKDDIYRGKIEDLFANKGLYVRDYHYRDWGTIERVVSNYPFEGFSKFEFKNIGDKKHFF